MMFTMPQESTDKLVRALHAHQTKMQRMVKRFKRSARRRRRSMEPDRWLR